MLSHKPGKTEQLHAYFLSIATIHNIYVYTQVQD